MQQALTFPPDFIILDIQFQILNEGWRHVASVVLKAIDFMPVILQIQQAIK